MSLSDLSTGGWVWFAITCMSALMIVVRLISLAAFKSDTARARIFVGLQTSIFFFVIECAWLLWLVTP